MVVEIEPPPGLVVPMVGGLEPGRQHELAAMLKTVASRGETDEVLFGRDFCAGTRLGESFRDS